MQGLVRLAVTMRFYEKEMAAISYRQRDWFHGTIKENKGNTDSIVVRLGSCIFMQSEE